MDNTRKPLYEPVVLEKKFFCIYSFDLTVVFLRTIYYNEDNVARNSMEAAENG